MNSFAWLRTRTGKRLAAACFLLGAVLGANSAFAARIPDVTNTKHNLSIRGPGDVKASPRTLQSQVCVFCHTPHGATLDVTPLWNRRLSTANYTLYTSSSLDAGALTPPGGSSKLCLSCHDGTLAIGNVNVTWGSGTADTVIQMSMLGTAGADAMDIGGKMPYGGRGDVAGTASGVLTGYTRNLDINLKNDHPISVNYIAALARDDGELRNVNPSQQSLPTGAGGYYTAGKIIGVRSSGYRPLAPLEPTGTSNLGQVQCATCHDPHLRETDPKLGNQKFLRLNRFQEQPPSVEYDGFNDINCVACHDKNFSATWQQPTNAATWAYSVHANPLVSTIPQVYKADAAAKNEFPTEADGAATNLPMWKASCLNCHDTHSVQGSRWLLREGTDAEITLTRPVKVGGKSAIEETCYQCHSNSADSAVENGNPAADIEADFALRRRMPITLGDQQNNVGDTGNPPEEVHDVGSFSIGGDSAEAVDCASSAQGNKCGADLVESRARLGRGSAFTGTLYANRHVECTDCHNPHRVVKFQTLEGNTGDLSGAPDEKGTHKHTDAAGYTHTNIASGALRGTYGVEPAYALASTSFNDLPESYSVKRGDPGKSTLGVADCHGETNRVICNGKSYVTREYQICLKCHSDYGYNDNNQHPYNNIPELVGGALEGLTQKGTNGMTHYTNQAREFQAPFSHMGEVSSVSPGASGADPIYQINPQTNYRSWHPVMDKTGRTAAIRGVTATAVFAPNTLGRVSPWSHAVGDQTMYCSDCHGSSSAADSAIPASGRWGPHGSENDFILKGDWKWTTGGNTNLAGESNALCFKCHDEASYAQGTGGAGSRTGFWLADVNMDGHQRHVDLILGGGVTNTDKGLRCSWCHVAVPHGWKNKALLVNLNDVGPEGGFVGTGNEVRINSPNIGYDNPPYYMNAMLKVINFKASGHWTAADCGSPAGSTVGNGKNGVEWMTTNTESCIAPP